MIETGSEAPDFDLEVDSSMRVRLSDFRGRRNVLLVFHPFAFTPVCEEEALDLQENLPSFESAETDVLLVSCDSAPSRQAWKEKLGLTYTLASDFWPHGEAARAYGVFNEEQGRAGPRHLPDRQGRNRRLEPRQRRRHAPRPSSSPPRSPPRRVTLARYEWGDEGCPRSSACTASRATAATSPSSPSGSPSASTSSRSTCAVTATRPGSRRGTSSSTSPTCSRPRRRRAAPGSATPSAAVLPTRPPPPPGARRAARPARPRDPAPADVGLAAAENARRDRSYVSFDGGDRPPLRGERAHDRAARARRGGAARAPVEDDDGRWRYRYCQSTVVAAYGEMTRRAAAVRARTIPTLLVLGETSYLRRRPARGAPGRARRPARGRPHAAGHTVLWDAFDETAGAVERFLPLGGPGVAARVDGGRERVDDARSSPAASRRRRSRAARRPSPPRRRPRRACTEGAEHLARLRRRPDAAEHAGARRDTAAGLFRTGDSASGRDAQSSAFLSTPGNRRVVLRRRDQDGVRGVERRLELLHGERLVRPGGRRRRRRAESPSARRTARGRRRRARPRQPPRSRSVLWEPGRRLPRGEDLHRYACTSARLAVMMTSSPSAGPPPGRSMFQSMP